MVLSSLNLCDSNLQTKLNLPENLGNFFIKIHFFHPLNYSCTVRKMWIMKEFLYIKELAHLFSNLICGMVQNNRNRKRRSFCHYNKINSFVRLGFYKSRNLPSLNSHINFPWNIKLGLFVNLRKVSPTQTCHNSSYCLFLYHELDRSCL